MDMEWAGEIAALLNRFLDGELSNVDAVRALGALIAIGGIGFVMGRWRSMILRIAILRRLIDPRARYAGAYLEVFNDDSNNKGRCTIIDIVYDAKPDAYIVEGHVYDIDTDFKGTFRSNFVRFPNEERQTIEFTWGSFAKSPHFYSGYTLLDVVKSQGEKELQGTGFLIRFQEVNKVSFDYYFLSDRVSKQLSGRKAPKTEAQRRAFVAAFRSQRVSSVSSA